MEMFLWGAVAGLITAVFIIGGTLVYLFKMPPK